MSMIEKTKKPANETPLPQPTIPYSFGWGSGLESPRSPHCLSPTCQGSCSPQTSLSLRPARCRLTTCAMTN